MSQKELRVAGVIERVLAKTLRVKEAASELCVNRRTISRLMKKIRKDGSSTLAHASRGKPSHHRLAKDEQEKMDGLLKERYADFGPTFAAEKLKELHGVNRDVKTVRSRMIALNLWKPAKGRAAVLHRQWRERRSSRGELVQYDGSYHNWLGGRDGSTEQCLLAAIDDATGELLQVLFAPHEGTLPTMGFWQDYALLHGLPRAIYVDKFSTYKMNHEIAKENPETKTQFKRAMDALRVELIFANSPQAKGRVERGFRTLQDRLVKELRLRNIDTTEEANIFLRDVFIPDFNKRFAHPAREKQDLHRLLTEEEQAQMISTLCKEETRIIMNDFTIPHGHQWYQLLPTQRLVIRPKESVMIRTHPKGTVTLTIREKMVNWKTITKLKALSAKQRERQGRATAPSSLVPV